MSQFSTRADLSFLPDGEAGDLIRHKDWTSTGLGNPDQWPQSLKTVTSMLLMSPVPIVLLWGVKGIMIYNDAYSEFAGDRHPRLLGAEVRKGWAEIADFNDNVMRVGLAGKTLAYKDQVLTLHRHGRPEQVWMNLDYSPVFDESGQPAGVIAIVVETTQRVRADRNLQLSEQRFRALVNATADLTYRLSPDWKDLVYLQGQSTPASNSHDALSWLDTYALPAEHQRIGLVIDQAIRDKDTFDMEHQTLRSDGSVGWMLSRVVPICDDGGNILERFGAATDITSRREAEEALRSDEKRLLFLDELGKETSQSTDADVIMATTKRCWVSI